MENSALEGIDYYKILGVSTDASLVEIKEAYSSRVKEFRAALSSGRRPEASQLDLLRKAYRVLSDDSERHAYEQKNQMFIKPSLTERDRHSSATEVSFFASQNSKLGKTRKGLWLGCLLGILIAAVTSKGKIGPLFFTTIFMLAIFAPLDWVIRRKLRNKEPQITLYGDGIESSIFSQKVHKVLWADIEQVSIKSIQNSKFLEFQVSPKLWLSRGKTNLLRIPLASFEADDLNRIVAGINLHLQQDRANRGEPHRNIENPLIEEQEFQARLRSFAPTPWATYLLVAINVIVWIFMLTKGASFIHTPTDKLLAWGGNAASEVQKGEWWRLLTSMFLHAGFMHLFMNMVGLLSIGITVERIYGHRLFSLIYFGSGLIGSALSLNFAAQHVVSVGASGAIFGVAGAMLVGMYQHKEKLPKSIGKQSISGIALFILFNLVHGFSAHGIDNAAHIGGLLGGSTLAFLLPVSFDREHFFRTLGGRAFAGVAVILIATTGLAAMAPHATLDQSKSILSQQAFLRGMDEFSFAAKTIQKDQANIKSGKITEREVDDRSRTVYAPMYKQIIKDLSQVNLSPSDPRINLLEDVRHMSMLLAESFEMESIYKDGSDKPEAADPERMAAIQLELKEVSTRFKLDIKNINSKHQNN